MKIGIDFYDTITVSPKIYKKLAETIIAGGGEIHIITAVKSENEERVRADVKQSNLPHTELHVVAFTDYEDVPLLKAKVAGKLGLDMLIDDRKDTCELMYFSHIVGLQSLGGQI